MNHSNTKLYKKFSIGISFYKMTADDWINILNKYHFYINDIFFSPIESIDYQTRRNIYNYEKQDQFFLEGELNKVLSAALDLCVARKIVLNVPKFLDNPDELLIAYQRYKSRYDIEYVTTFLSCARKIKEIDNSQQIICSYNQGIKTEQELEKILESNLFFSIVLGTNFYRNINAFRLIHQYEQKIELLLNNGCMSNCASFCRLPNKYCKNNFAENLLHKGINCLYAECSMFPEEIHKYFLPNDLIDYYKLSTRPIYFRGMIDMLSSYIEGESSKYINTSVTNYNLYGRLAHYSGFYKELKYEEILKNKEAIWEQIKNKII